MRGSMASILSRVAACYHPALAGPPRPRRRAPALLGPGGEPVPVAVDGAAGVPLWRLFRAAAALPARGLCAGHRGLHGRSHRARRGGVRSRRSRRGDAWLASVRRRHGRPTVAVAHAALERDDAEAVLAAHAAFDFVRGIRQKPEPGQMSDARWRRGYAWLARHRLSYDLQAPCGLFAEAAALARDFPDTPIVVNHTGLPVDRSEAGLAAWRRALETVAAPPNVALKISGLGRPDKSWPVSSNERVVRDAIAIFGVARCLFASNYPVDSLCAGFDAIYRAFGEFN